MRTVNPYLLILPAFIIVGFNAFVPLFYALYLSTLKYYLGIGEAQFIGYDNFRKIVFDWTLFNSFVRGLAFSGLSLAIELVLGLGIALLLQQETRTARLIRTVLAVPLLIPPMTVGCMWLLLVRPDIGPIPRLLANTGIVYDIGANPLQAFVTTVIMDVWHWTPFVVLVLIAALLTLPLEPYESAKVDGASAWRIFRYITLPGLRYPLLVVGLIRLMDTLKIFDEVWILISEGPGKATNFFSIYIVKTALSELNMGYGATLSLFFLYVVILLSWAVMLFVSERP
jgi:multiple sugar transport system permease protein